MGHTNIYRDVLKAQFKSGGLGVFAINTPIAGFWREKNSAGFWIENAQGREGKHMPQRARMCTKGMVKSLFGQCPKNIIFMMGLMESEVKRYRIKPYQTIPRPTKTIPRPTKPNLTNQNQASLYLTS